MKIKSNLQFSHKNHYENEGIVLEEHGSIKIK